MIHQFFLNEHADAVAIDVAERQDRAVADVGPTERARVVFARDDPGNVAPPFERQHRQLRRDLVSLDAGYRPPDEMSSQRSHDGFHLILEGMNYRQGRRLFEGRVQNRGQFNLPIVSQRPAGPPARGSTTGLCSTRPNS